MVHTQFEEKDISVGMGTYEHMISIIVVETSMFSYAHPIFFIDREQPVSSLWVLRNLFYFKLDNEFFSPLVL